MALVIETGQGATDAESYATVAQFRTYNADRGRDVTALTDTEIEALLRAGFDYMMQNYRLRWAGYRKTIEQYADWPREFVPREPLPFMLQPGVILTDDVYYPIDAVPLEVRRANMELAFRAQTEELSIEFERLTTEETVGSLTVKYDKSARDKRVFPFIENLLRPFLKAGGGGAIVRG